MNYLFCYGTLLEAEIIKGLIGRVPSSIKATWITGYKVRTIEDEGVYLQVYFTGNSEDIIPGQIIIVSDDEIRKINEWEGDEYILGEIDTFHQKNIKIYMKDERRLGN